MKAQHFYTSAKLDLDNREPKTHLDTCGVLKHITRIFKSIWCLMAGSTEISVQRHMMTSYCICLKPQWSHYCTSSYFVKGGLSETCRQRITVIQPMSQKHELIFQYLYATTLSNLFYFSVDNKSFVPPECTWSPKKSPQLKFTSTFCTDEDQAVFMCSTEKGQIFRHCVNSIIKHSGLIFFMFKAILGQSELHFIRNGDQMLLWSLQQNNVSLLFNSWASFLVLLFYLPLDLIIPFCLQCFIRDTTV